MLSLAGVPYPDILRGVVIRVHFVAALLAPELFTVTVVVVRKPTVRSRTALRRMVRPNLFDRDTTFWCLVFDVLIEPSKCPDMVPFRLWQPLTNVSQILEYDYLN